MSVSPGTERRFKILTISRDLMMNGLFGMATIEHGVLRSVRVDGLPKGYQAGAAMYDFNSDVFRIRIHHESFPEVDHGAAADALLLTLFEQRIGLAPSARENAILRSELQRQTGCQAEDIEALLERGMPVLNRRMGEELRKRFLAEEALAEKARDDAGRVGEESIAQHEQKAEPTFLGYPVRFKEFL